MMDTKNKTLARLILVGRKPDVTQNEIDEHAEDMNVAVAPETKGQMDQRTDWEVISDMAFIDELVDYVAGFKAMFATVYLEFKD